jgi:hypothetical protein
MEIVNSSGGPVEFRVRMSKAEAKKQAVSESHLSRNNSRKWEWLLVTPAGWRSKGADGKPMPYSVARRELAAWRAARVRELMGKKVTSFGADPDCNPSPKVEHDARGWEPK